MASSNLARQVVEKIRATKFGIGSSQKNPLALDMHQAITHLSAELYQKDLHFVMELVQNADDNTYAEEVVPELEFVLVEADVAGVGVEWTLLVLNNEVGFSEVNMESLCSIGLSTKKGKRDSGYIGEKGIGFKSVFLITSHPIVISNGFRIRFNDAPTNETDLGFIVPEWTEQPSNADLLDCLGVAELPNTIIVLPIRSDKVQAMREQLFQLSPQLVLFLNKIEKLSVRQLNFSRSSKGVAVSKDMRVQRHKSPSPSSCASFIPNTCTHSVVHLSSPNQEAVYHLWQQEFPVCADHEVDHRRDVHTWMITLAFPLHKEKKSDSGPDLYAFLPTKVTAGFPFLINADFLLVSSRENIRFESIWNKGILSCIPQAFMAAFMFLLKAVATPCASADTQLRSIYNFVPCRALTIKELGFVQEAILEQLKKHDIILCAANLGQHFPAGTSAACSVQMDAGSRPPFFCLPHLARTIQPEFGRLLELANKAKVLPPKPLMSQITYIVDAEVMESYQFVLKTLKVKSLEEQDYIEIVKSTNWLESLAEAMYVDVLYFLSRYILTPNAMNGLPLIKYLDERNNTMLLAPAHKATVPVYMSRLSKDELIVSSWRPTFQPWVGVQFMPTKTVQEIHNASADKQHTLYRWLKDIANVQLLSVQSYGGSLVQKCRERPSETALIVSTMHFFLHAIHDGYLSLDDCRHKLSELPLVGISNSGRASARDFKRTVFLPGSVCKWPRLLLDNAWNNHIFCLSESYLKVPSIMRPSNIQTEEVVQFLKKSIGAVDIFDMKSPPDAPIVIHAIWDLSAEDVKLFLDWIKGFSYIPSKFKASLEGGAWVKTMDHGSKLPSRSILDLGGPWTSSFHRKDVPFVDTGFYGDLRPYRSILANLGIVTTVEHGGKAVAEHVRELATGGVSSVQSDTAIRWYKFLRLHNWMGWSTSSTEKLIWVPGRSSIQWSLALGSWMCPDECVISDDGGLFQERLVVLNRYYKDEFVLAFFQQNMGVAATPGTEKYCQLWVDWGESRREISREACENAWRIISKGWGSCSRVEAQSFKRRCRVPCFTSNAGAERIELARPDEVLYADNLVMAEVFDSQKVKFAWYPRSAAAGSWVEELIKCYTDVGVKKLSAALDEGGPSSYRRKIKPSIQYSSGGTNTGAWQVGVFRAVLGYLADPKHGLSARARKRMVVQLQDVELFQVEEVGEVTYRVAQGRTVYEASRAVYVRWEKGEKRIYVARRGGCNKVKVAHELAGEVAKGVVGVERVALVDGLQEVLLLAAGFEFEDKAVQELLSLRNLRLTLEDEALLQDLKKIPSRFGHFSSLF